MAWKTSYVFILFFLYVLSGKEVGIEFVFGRDVVFTVDFDLLLDRDASGHELSSTLKEKRH